MLVRGDEQVCLGDRVGMPRRVTRSEVVEGSAALGVYTSQNWERIERGRGEDVPD